MQRPEMNDLIYLEDFNIAQGGEKTVGLKLTNMNRYTAFQCDLFLPENLAVTLDADGNPFVELDENLSTSHMVSSSFVSNGAIRILVMSMNNGNLNETSENIVYLKVKAKANQNSSIETVVVKIDNARVVDQQSLEEYEASATTANVGIGSATAIGSIDVNNLKIRTIDHQLVIESPAAATVQLVSTDGVSRSLQLQPGVNRFYIKNAGVYILGRKKIIIN